MDGCFWAALVVAGVLAALVSVVLRPPLLISLACGVAIGIVVSEVMIRGGR